MEYYNADSTPVQYYVYEYDSDGNCVRSEFYDASQTLLEYHVYEYDRDGNLVRAETYNAEGSRVNYAIVDESGQLTWYDVNGTPQ